MYEQSGINPDTFRYHFQGEWSPGKVYRKNDIVRIDGCTYYCKTNDMAKNGWYGYEFHPKKSAYYGPNGGSESHAYYWGIHTVSHVWRGAWSEKAIYQAGDIVKVDGEWWQCVVGSSLPNNHPIYRNGSTSSGWRKTMAAYNTDELRYTCTAFANRNPIGWQYNMGHCGGIGDSTTLRSTAQMLFINGQGQPMIMGGQLQTYAFGGGGPYDWNVTRSAAASSGGANKSLKAINTGWDYMSRHAPNTVANGNHENFMNGGRKCIQLVTCAYNTLALMNDGTVFNSGYNGHGQMGTGSTTDYNFYTGGMFPVGQPATSNFTANNSANHLYNVHVVKVGMTGIDNSNNSSTMYALDANGNMWAWGYNGNGQCAQGRSDHGTHVYEPNMIDPAYFDNRPIRDFWVTGDGANGACFAINDDHQIWAWGYNGNGGLGNGDFVHQWRPQLVKYDWSKFGGIKKFIGQGYGSYDGRVVLCNDGSLHMWGYIMGDSQAHQHGMDRAASVCTPQHANMAYWSVNRQLQRTNTMDQYTIGDDIDDIFYIGSRYKAVMMKQKGTGDMYVSGYETDYAYPTPYPAAANNATNTEFYSHGRRWPTKIALNGLNDITHVTRCKTGGTRSLIWMNSDGRAVQTGYRGQYQAADGYDEPATELTDSANRHFHLNEMNGMHNSARNIKGPFAGQIVDVASNNAEHFFKTNEGRVYRVGPMENYYNRSSVKRHDNTTTARYSYGMHAMCDGQV